MEVTSQYSNGASRSAKSNPGANPGQAWRAKVCVTLQTIHRLRSTIPWATRSLQTPALSSTRSQFVSRELVFPRCRSMLSAYTSTTSFVSVITTHGPIVSHGYPFNRKHES